MSLEEFIRKFKLIKVKYKYSFYDEKNIKNMNDELEKLLDDYKIHATVKFNRSKSNMVLGTMAFTIDEKDSSDDRTEQFLKRLYKELNY